MANAMKFLCNKWALLAAVLVPTLALDQWTKWLVHTRFRVGETLPLIDGFFSLTYIRNQGAAFGLLHTASPAFREPFFMAVPVIAVCVMSVLYYRLEAGQKCTALALALVISGAIGNFIDRMRLGYVIDFLDAHWHEAYHWPAFNVADSCIVGGVILLFLLSLKPTSR